MTAVGERLGKHVPEILDLLNLSDDILSSKESFAIGVGSLAAALVGYNMRHPEIAMYFAAEAGDVAQELMSEVGGLTSAVEVMGD